jgi:type VI secretion system protein ImpC
MTETFDPDFGTLDLPAPTWNPKRPLRIALLGDFGAGAGRGRLETGATLGKRKPLKVEFDSIEDAMQRLGVSLRLPLGADAVPVEIELNDLDAFHPDTIYAEVPLFAELASLRKRLNQAGSFPAASAEVMAWAENAGPRASSLARKAAARGSAPSRGATLDDFARLTGRPSVATKGDGEVHGLVQRIVGPFVQAAESPKKDALVAAVDAGLGDAMRALLHHPDFQTSEALWRGVDFLVRRIETGPGLQVQLIDVTAEEFAADLGGAADLSETGLYQLLVGTPSQEADGGYTYIAGCYQFDATPPHAELLGRAARIAAHAGAPLLVGIATDPFTDRREPPHRLVREAFTALRALPEASFLGLLGPRFMLRHPYGKKTDPVSSFAFEEFSAEAGLRGMLWGHPALLALSVLARPEGSLAVGDLPFHHHVDKDGDSVALPCTDRLISTGAASLLREVGINAVMAHKGEGLVRFNGLEATNGDGLRAVGAMPKKAPSAARFALQSKIDTEEKTASVQRAASPVRKRVAAQPSDEAEATEDAREEVAAEASDDPVEEADQVAATDDATNPDSDGSSDAASSKAKDDSDAEAASGDGEQRQPAAGDEPANAPDAELSALLASLDPASDSGDKEPAAEEEAPMDPDLAALLKSLG